jgi:hypothetical protein
MPDKTISQEQENDPLVDYVSKKYYEGGQKSEIKTKLYSDKATLEKMIGEAHAENDQGLSLGEFQTAYYENYGNPFEKKKDIQPSSGLPKPNQEPQDNTPTSYQESVKAFTPKPSESGDGSLDPSSDKPISDKSKSDLKNNQTPQEWEGSVGYAPKEDTNAYAKLLKYASVQTYLASNRADQEYRKNTGAKDNRNVAESMFDQFIRTIAESPAVIESSVGVLLNKYERSNPYNLLRFTGRKSELGSVADFMISDAKHNKDMLSEVGIIQGSPEHPLANTISSVGADILTTIASGGSKTAATSLNYMSKASTFSVKAAGSIGKVYSNPGALIAASKVIDSEYNQALAGGATEEQATDVALINGMAAAPLEYLPVAHLLKRIGKVTGTSPMKIVANTVVTGTVNGFEEGFTETMQTGLSNVTAAETYDATRKIYEGMGEGGTIGFGIGFVLTGLGVSLRKKQSLAQTPQEKAEIQRAIDYVDDKARALESGKLTDQGQWVAGGNNNNIINGSPVAPDKTTVDKNEWQGTSTSQSPTSEQVPQEQVAPTEEVVAQEEVQTTEQLGSQRAEILANLPIDEQTGEPIVSPEAEQQLAEIDARLNSMPTEGKITETVPTEEVVTQEQIPVQENVPAEEIPTEIEGLKVIRRAEDAPNGEAVYEVEGDRFVTADGKELKGVKNVAENVIPVQQEVENTPVVEAEVKPQEVAPEVKVEPKTEVAKFEEERDAEIEKISKPLFKLDLVQTSDLVNSKDPIGNKEKHKEIKDKYKALRALIECL